MRHVAWPTRMQTVVYSVLVAAVSIIVALYLGLFDLLFTSSLARFLEALPVNIPTQVQQIDTSASSTFQLTESDAGASAEEEPSQ